jgi:O-antigen/teichoic acid export membrane protein
MLKQKFVIQFSSTILLKILGMIAGIFVARFAGPEVVGTIAYGTAYVSILAFITSLFGTPHMKLVSEGKPLDDCIHVYTRLQLSSIFVYFILVALWVIIQKFVLGFVFESRTHETVIWLALLSIVAYNLFTLTQNTYIARQEQAKANLPYVFRDLIYQSGRIVLVVLGFKAIALSSWNLFSVLIVFPLGYKYFKELPWGKTDPELRKQYIKLALPILLIIITNSITAYSGQLFLQHYTSTREVGYFTAAFSIGGMIILIGNTAGTIFFPLFSSLIKKGEWSSVNRKIKQYQNFIAIFLFPSVCGLTLIGGPLLTTLLGDAYIRSVAPFGILVFASYVVILGMPYGNVISGMGKFYRLVSINVIILAFYCVSIFILISPSCLGLGAVGLALNFLAVNIATNVLYIFISVKAGKISTDTRNIVRYPLIGATAWLFHWLVPRSAFSVPFVWPVVFLVYLGATYAFLAVVRLVEKKDVRQLLEILNLKKTVEYARDEMTG